MNSKTIPCLLPIVVIILIVTLTGPSCDKKPSKVGMPTQAQQEDKPKTIATPNKVIITGAVGQKGWFSGQPGRRYSRSNKISNPALGWTSDILETLTIGGQ